MLAWYIIGEAHARALQNRAADQGEPADFVVTSNAEWDAVFARSAAELSGKIVEIQGNDFDEVVIDDRDMVAAGAPLVIRSADSGSALQALRLDGVTRGIDFSGLNIQMRGWPANYRACVTFNKGTFGTLRFTDGTRFRHGYGAQLTDIDTAADLPEYERIDNVRTAIASSATYALSWKDASATTGQIEFFNRGTETVHVAVGGAGVTASTGATTVAPGTKLRLSSLNPTSDTHFAIISATGTSEVNARAEIGLAHYLAYPFATSGAGTLEDIEIVGCAFEDLAHGVKGLTSPTDVLVMDNDFSRIYQDIITVTPAVGGEARILRNFYEVPFSRSGIAENLHGDAGDPHGDAFQMFDNGVNVIGPVYFAGNVPRIGELRLGAKSQGVHVSDNDHDPSYTDIYVIASAFIGGAGNALTIGWGDYPIRDVFAYGITIVDRADRENLAPAPRVFSNGVGTCYFGNLVTPRFLDEDHPVERDNVVLLSDAESIPAVLPNFDDLAGAVTRAQVQTALATAAEGTGFGFSASMDAIDWTTGDPDSVILWENMPSGAHWNAVGQLSPSAVTELPLRKIMNRRANQGVVPGAGVEWRSVDTDGGTELQAWTFANGTIEPGQYIQIRATSAAGSLDTVTVGITINGFAQSVELTTGLSSAESLAVPAAATYLVDPSNVPAGTTRITFRGKLYFPAHVPQSAKPFSQFAQGVELITRDDGSLQASVEDGTGAKMLNGATIAPAGTIAPDEWFNYEYDVDQVSRVAILTVNGAQYTLPFAATGNGLFQSNRTVAFLATSSGASSVPTGTRAADLSVDFNGVLHKAISNNAATANADPWKQGWDFADG